MFITANEKKNKHKNQFLENSGSSCNNRRDHDSHFFEFLVKNIFFDFFEIFSLLLHIRHWGIRRRLMKSLSTLFYGWILARTFYPDILWHLFHIKSRNYWQWWSRFVSWIGHLLFSAFFLLQHFLVIMLLKTCNSEF